MNKTKFQIVKNYNHGDIIYVTNKKNNFKLDIINLEYFEKKTKEKKDKSFTTTQNQTFIINNYIYLSDKCLSSDKLEDVRILGAKSYSSFKSEKIQNATIFFDLDQCECDITKAFIEGFMLSNYKFENYKSKKDKTPLINIDIIGCIEPNILNEISNIVEAVHFSRNLVNEPVITLNTQKLSEAFENAGKCVGFTTMVLQKKEIENLKMGGLLGVNKGSIDPPTFNIMEWKPDNVKNKKPIVLVGKGVVYDTGGNNLKPGGYMSTMKCDMGGSAAVGGSMYAIAKNKLPLWVIGLVPATDNRIGMNALVADDVITISDGTTVEVKNTDAEGRLILADALVYAQKYNPELVIDFATLTGAAAAITGEYGILMVQKAKDEQVEKLKKTGDKVYERIAEMPFWREYDKLLDSSIADISNLGGPTGGAITAGKFLHRFTKYDWIHLDIAGTAFISKQNGYKSEGGTGVGVRLIYDYLKNNF